MLYFSLISLFLSYAIFTLIKINLLDIRTDQKLFFKVDEVSQEFYIQLKNFLPKDYKVLTNIKMSELKSLYPKIYNNDKLNSFDDFNIDFIILDSNYKPSCIIDLEKENTINYLRKIQQLKEIKEIQTFYFKLNKSNDNYNFSKMCNYLFCETCESKKYKKAS